MAAFLALKVAPSLAGTASRYDDFVQEHVNSMTNGQAWAHRRPAFLPWHREYLRRFELALQQHEPTVTLPYWDWTVDNTPAASLWAPDFLGGDGTGPNGEVATGAFAFANGNWTLNFGPTQALTRAFGQFPNVQVLPSAAEVAACQTQVPYDAAPWNDSGALQSYRNRLEGWFGPGSIHNRVHLWVGGAMLPEHSPNDPVFWLHHCNIDRLWAEWQLSNPTYLPVAGGPSGHNLNDSMQPWGGTTTPASTLDHHALGYWYDTDEPEVDLTTPSLSFADVPQGLGGAPRTTYRAIVFEVRSCDPVTLSIVAGPSGGFTTTPLGTSVVVPSAPGAAPAIGRLWIAYTTTTPGATANGSVTVAQAGSSMQWTISLAGNTIARPRSAVVLSLDRSGSMSDGAGDGLSKHAKLVDAAGVFVDTMLEGDGLGIVGYDDIVDRHFDVTDVGPQPPSPGSGRALAAALLSGPDLNPRGLTAIGPSLVEAQDVLNDGQASAPQPYDNLAIVVLTDGIENVDPKIAVVLPGITAATYAVGLGEPSGISVAALDALARATGKYLLVTGTLSQDQRFRLSKYFLQILAGITGAQIVVDPTGNLVMGATHRIPFHITAGDHGVDAIVTSPIADVIDFQLEAPDGTIVGPGTLQAGETRVVRNNLHYYRLPLPAGDPSRPLHAGRWQALLSIDERALRKALSDDRRREEILRELGRGTIAYNFLAHAYSTLLLRASLGAALAIPGERVRITATLGEFGVPLEARAAVWVEAASPDGVATTVKLVEVAPGAFAGDVQTFAPGLYALRVRARGTSLGGVPFTREVALSLVAQRESDVRPDPRGEDHSGDRLIDLLGCILEHGKGEIFGIPVEELRPCLEKVMRKSRRAVPLERRIEAPPARPPARERALGLEELPFRMQEPAPPPEFPPVEHGHDPDAPMFGLSPQDLARDEAAIRRAFDAEQAEHARSKGTPPEQERGPGPSGGPGTEGEGDTKGPRPRRPRRPKGERK